MKNTLILLALCLSSLSLWGQASTEELKDSIEARISKQLTTYPQEKVYLHIDRDHYSANDTIWLRAYLLDAYTQKYRSQSRYVYVELISPKDELVHRTMIRPEQDMHYGYIPIPEQAADGEYTLRAYTRYMKTLGEDYFFRKKILIAPLLNSRYTQCEETGKVKETPTEPDYEVYFFPEGGHLLQNKGGQIAFKALDENGNSVAISGQVLNEKGDEVTSVQTLHGGMGSFYFFPQPGETYSLYCTNDRGVTKSFELPASQADAHALACHSRNNQIYLARAHSFESEPEGNFYLLAHCKGEVLFFISWNDSRKTLTLPKEDLPGGIIHLLLLDEQLNALSERLCFSSNYTLAEIDFETDKAKHATREQVISQLIVADEQGYPLQGTLSVSVTDDQEQVIDTLSENILSHLLLSSELPGYIENPGYYFPENASRDKELELLMLTHGWRRYNMPEVIKGNAERPYWAYQRTMNMSGTVKGLIITKPVKDASVFFLTNRGFFDTATTDDQGRFFFTNYELPEGTSYFVQSTNKRGGNRVELLVNPEEFPELHHLPVRPIREVGLKDLATEKAQQRMIYDEKMRMVYLNAVEVKSKAPKKKPTVNEWYSMGSDVSITRERIEETPVMFAYELLQGIAGVQVDPDGSISIRGQGAPAIYIDGMKEDDSTILSYLSISEVEQIDVFKGANAAIFGSNGGSGVIAVTLRRGGAVVDDRERFNVKTVSPQGYQEPVEFYSPRYDNPSAGQGLTDFRTTLYWKPNLKTDEEGWVGFDFYTGDFKTTYSVIIEGVTQDGQIIRSRQKITVE